MSTGNARQVLLPTIELPSHGSGEAEKNDKLEKHSNGFQAANSNSTSIQTLQISRRPSLLLQDILGRRPSALFRGKNGKEANGHASKSPFGYRFKHVRHAIVSFFSLYIFSIKIYLLSISFYSSPYIYVHTNAMGMAQSVTCGHCRHFYGHNQRTWGWRRSTLCCEANESQKSA